MHMLIHGLVYAEDEDEALESAKQDVFDPLVQHRTFDYYVTFDQEGNGVAGRDRWGPLRAAAHAETDIGEQQIRTGWKSTVDQYETSFERIEEFLEERQTDDFWEDLETYHEYRHHFDAVSEHRGPSTHLYNQNGQGIRNRSQLEDAYRQPENQDQELFAVPADVHY